jgi:hypothetical protein
VAADGAAEVMTLDGYPGVEIARLWSTDGGNVLDSSVIGRDSPSDGLYPPPGGTRFVRITYPPGFGACDPDADASTFARLLLHRSATIDYGVILAGELTLVLEDGSQSVLRAGDVVVQNGTVHGWRNTASTTAVAAFVLVGCRS